MSKKQEKKHGIVECFDCTSSELMQWGNDPIIAKCRETGNMDVAKAKRKCNSHNKSKSVKPIKRYIKHYGRSN